MPDQNLLEVSSYVVSLLGAQGVGKTALISQFMTSECINAYDRQKGAVANPTRDVREMFSQLEEETSSLGFRINEGKTKYMLVTKNLIPRVKQNITNNNPNFETDVVDKIHHPPDAFIVLYSVVDKASFLKAETELSRLQDTDQLRSRPFILVANKIDLARSRAVSTQDGKCLACTYRAKFIEISVGINHNVDELLVGILTQIRLKVHNFDESGHTQQWYKSRGMVKASMKARQMFTWLFGREDSKFKNCENLHIL
uniref:GTP-binding protein GEM-like n=1 Tax=Diabrotica virgifera virgifera TaxID=50390 RepID=A0A6P7GCW3_DIAVI